MIKKVIDFNSLPKQEYQKPAIEILEADVEQQILAASVTSVMTTGLNDEDLTLPDKEEPKSGSIWDDAW